MTYEPMLFSGSIHFTNVRFAPIRRSYSLLRVAPGVNVGFRSRLSDDAERLGAKLFKAASVWDWLNSPSAKRKYTSKYEE